MPALKMVAVSIDRSVSARLMLLATLAAFLPAGASAQSFTTTVDSRSDLYAAGHATVPVTPHGGGTLPPFVVLQPGTGPRSRSRP